MKKLWIYFILVISCAQTSLAQVNKIEVMAAGLTCSLCSKAIYKQLVSLPEVDSVATNLKTTTYTIYTKPDLIVNPNTVRKKIEDAGFFVGKLIVFLNNEKNKFENNKLSVAEGWMYFLVNETNNTLTTVKKFMIINKGFLLSKQYKYFTKLYGKNSNYLKEKPNEFYVISI